MPTIPTKKSEIFSTAADSQTAVSIHVLQGEREMARDNRTLGRFDLIGIPPAPRGVPQIEVTFDIDANGIVHVSAKDLGTSKEQKIRIESSSGLSQEEIDRMVNEAKSHAEDDRKKREEITLRNNADSLIYTLEKTMNEVGDKIPKSEKTNIENAIEKLKKKLESGTMEDIKTAMDELNKASHRISEILYKAHTAQQSEGAGSEPRQGPSDSYTSETPQEGEVVDAEYEVKNGDKE